MTPPGTLRARTARGLLWASGEAVARTVLQAAVLILLARLLTPEDYGVVGAALIVVGLSSIFAQLGVGPAIVQRSHLEREHLDAAFVLSLLFGILTAGAVFVSAPALTRFFGGAENGMAALTPTLRVLSSVFPVAAIGVVTESLLQRELRFDLIARTEVMSLLTYGLVAVALASLGWGIWALVTGQIVQIFVKTVLLFYYSPWRPRLSCRSSAVRDLFGFSTGLTVARLANYVATNGDKLVVGRYLGAAELGAYGRAYQLMSQPAQLIGNVLEKVLFPAMAKVQNSDQALGRIYCQGVGLLASIMLPGSIIIYLLAPEIVRTLLGARWAGVIFPLQIFSVALLFRTSMKMSNSLIRAKGAVYQMAGCQIVYALTTLAGAFVGRAWGIEGVCVGVLVSIVLCFFLAAYMSLRLVGVSWFDFLAEHLPGIGLAAIAYAVGWLVQGWLHREQTSDALVLLLSLAAMAGICTLLAALFPQLFLGPEGERLRGHARLFLSRASSAS